MGANFTYGYRKPTANRIYRVSDWSGTWQDARDRGTAIAAKAHEDLHFFVLTTRDYDETNPTEDSHNMMSTSGKRIPLVDITEVELLGRVDVQICRGCDAWLRVSDGEVCEQCDAHGFGPKDWSPIDQHIAGLGSLDPVMAASYQSLIEQLDYDGLLNERRALMVCNGIAGAIAAFHNAPLDSSIGASR